MSVHVLMPKGREIESRDAIYFWHERRDGDVQVERVYEHSSRAQKWPLSWHGPFASALDAAHAAVDERRGIEPAQTPASPAQCESVWAFSGVRCELLAGHQCWHKHSTGEWADPEPATVNVLERVEAAMASDYDNREKQNAYLVDAWQRANEAERAVVDEIFIALCGWALSTILAGTDHNEDDEEGLDGEV